MNVFGSLHRVRSSLILRIFIRIILSYFSVSLIVGCSKLPTPPVEVAAKLSQPTFSGQTSISLTTSVSSYTLNGECDKSSDALDYSYDQSTWLVLPGGCSSSGTFSIAVTVTTTKTVYVRARRDDTTTGVSVATITLSVPPASTMMAFVNSSISSESNAAEGNINNMGLTFDAGSADEISSVDHKFYYDILGVMYGQ